MQALWDLILRILPDNEPNTAAAIAGWLQGLATISALWFALRTLRHKLGESAESGRPKVVFDYHQADGDRGSGFVARNVGKGAALNSYFFDIDPRTNDASFIALGGLMPETEIRLATNVGNRLNQEVNAKVTARVPLYILAQAAVGEDWLLSINRVVDNSRVSHEVVLWTPPDALRRKLKALTVDERLREALAKGRPLKQQQDIQV
jgi:hypothetical protein